MYLGIAELTGLSILLLLYHSSFKKKNLVTYILIFVNSLILFISGGRGPLIFLFLIILVQKSLKAMKYLLSLKVLVTKKQFRRTVLLLIISICLTHYFYSNLPTDFQILIQRELSRLSYVLDPKHSADDPSLNARKEHIRFSIQVITSSIESFLFGYGIGSYNVLYNHTEGRGYPHNIVLETWVELGIVGTILLCSFLFSIFFLKKQKELLIPYIYMLLNAMKSSSLVDLRLFFAIISLTLILGGNEKRNQRHLTESLTGKKDLNNPLAILKRRET
jgi:O-antigen ligase